MFGQKSNLEKTLMGEEEIRKEIIMDFTSTLVEEVEKLIKEQGKEEILKLLNQ